MPARTRMQSDPSVHKNIWSRLLFSTRVSMRSRILMSAIAESASTICHVIIFVFIVNKFSLFRNSPFYFNATKIWFIAETLINSIFLLEITARMYMASSIKVSIIVHVSICRHAGVRRIAHIFRIGSMYSRSSPI